MNWDGPAYKYVPIEFADAVEQGKFKIGTAALYAAMESARADNLDSAVEGFQSKPLAMDAPGAFEIMKQFGVHLPNASGIFSGNRVRYVVPKTYALCFTSAEVNEHLWEQGDQALFRVSNLHRLAHILRVRNFSRLGPATIGPVQYARTQWDALSQPMLRPSPFLKGQGFAAETEVRIIWPAHHDTYQPDGFVSEPMRMRGLLERLK